MFDLPSIASAATSLIAGAGRASPALPSAPAVALPPAAVSGAASLPTAAAGFASSAVGAALLITGSADGATLHSVGGDVMVGGGAGASFAFTPGFGQDEIVDFVAGGQAHGTVDLSATPYHSLAQVLRHTTMADGSATVHLNAHDAITLDGVTRAQLRANPHDFAFS